MSFIIEKRFLLAAFKKGAHTYYLIIYLRKFNIS